jgi:hypothetical protein
MIPAKPVEEVIWLIGQCADLPRGNIQQVAEARSGIRQTKPEIRSLVDENHARRRSLPNQMKSREGSAYPSTDDCDCRGCFFPCSHVSTLGRNLRQRNSQILMPYKQGSDVDTKNFLAYTASLLLLGRDGLCGLKLNLEKEKRHE